MTRSGEVSEWIWNIPKRRFEVASPERGTRNVGYHGGTRYGVPLIGGPFPESDRKMLLGADYAVNLSPTI